MGGEVTAVERTLCKGRSLLRAAPWACPIYPDWSWHQQYLFTWLIPSDPSILLISSISVHTPQNQSMLYPKMFTFTTQYLASIHVCVKHVTPRKKEELHKTGLIWRVTNLSTEKNVQRKINIKSYLWWWHKICTYFLWVWNCGVFWDEWEIYFWKDNYFGWERWGRGTEVGGGGWLLAIRHTIKNLANE